jgi:hypothetical protein
MAFRQCFRRPSLLAPQFAVPIRHSRALFSSLVQPDAAATGIARLKTVNLAHLRSREPEALKSLQTACEGDGFFYLDLRNVDNGRMLRDWTSIQSLMRDWFNLPLDEKMKHHCGTVLHGYLT